jgi:phage baseplate assembly protein W
MCGGGGTTSVATAVGADVEIAVKVSEAIGSWTPRVAVQLVTTNTITLKLKTAIFIVPP